jgi:hypothetical protein
MEAWHGSLETYRCRGDVSRKRFGYQIMETA